MAWDYKPFDKQQAFHASPARFRLVRAGIRGGKTYCGAAEFVDRAWRDGDLNWVCAPTDRLLRVSKRETNRVLQETGMLKRRWRKDGIDLLKNGAEIEYHTAFEPDHLRGPTLKNVWVDEGSQVSKTAIDILVQRVSTTRGRIWTTTTPMAHAQWLRDWHERAQKGDPDYAEFMWTSRDNPHFPEEEWERMKRETPEIWFAQECEAKFVSHASSVFHGIREIVSTAKKMTTYPPYGIGADWGQRQDYFAIVVIDSKGQVVEASRHRGMGWNQQVDKAAAASEKWGNAHVVHDGHGVGDPIHEQLAKKITPFRTSNVATYQANKDKIIRALQSAIESQSITLPRNTAMIDELILYGYECLPSGSVRYSAPSGSHDDYVIALALANWWRHDRASTSEIAMIDVGDDGGQPSNANQGRRGMSLGGSRKGIQPGGQGMRRKFSMWR